MISGESIYSALFERLKATVTLCRRFERKYVEAQQFDPDQQPALLCLEDDEAASDDDTTPTAYVMGAVVIVYVRTNDTAVPGTAISNILDQIKAALQPQVGDAMLGLAAHTNLGGLVESAAIVGQIDKEDGTLTGGQGWISLSVRIVAFP